MLEPGKSYSDPSSLQSPWTVRISLAGWSDVMVGHMHTYPDRENVSTLLIAMPFYDFFHSLNVQQHERVRTLSVHFRPIDHTEQKSSE